MSDEGLFVTLENWKHHCSDWTTLEKIDGKLQTLTYKDEDRAKFPTVALGAFKNYVKTTYGARWYEAIKDNQSVADNGF